MLLYAIKSLLQQLQKLGYNLYFEEFLNSSLKANEIIYKAIKGAFIKIRVNINLEKTQDLGKKYK